jgi:O-antigen ligase
MSMRPSAGAVRPRRFPDWRAWPVLRGRFGERGPVDRHGGDWVNTILAIALVIGLGIVVGIQYVHPDKRVLAMLATAVIFGIAWRIDLVSGIGVLVLALPYPRGTVFGSTNLAMVLLLLIIWLLRASLRGAAPPQRTAVDRPIVALLLSFVVSFYNIRTGTTLVLAVENFLLLLACLTMFYLIVNNVRRPEQLERLHLFQCASIALVCLLGVYEVRHPSGILVPGWIEFHQDVSEAINLHNVRIGGPFFDFELLSEYCAVNLLLLMLWFVRARSGARRVLFGALLILASFVMFATVTRGGIVALAAGIGYLVWVQRKRFSAVTAGIALVAAVVGVQAMNFYVANFTYSGDLLGRLLDPQSLTFTHGLPAGRGELWASAFQRMMEHPLIGHGPVYTIQRELGFWYWPHNGYLYIGNLVGLIGLGFYIWLLARLWQLSRPLGGDLHDTNYARAYLNIARVQLLVFLVDQTKIDFMRNPIYQFQVWLLFAYIVAAYQASRPSAPAPAPALARS